MESNRIKERNRIYSEISRIEKYIETDNATEDRLRSMPFSNYNKTQIEKIREKNKTRDQDLQYLQDRLVHLNDGMLDQELVQERKRSQREVDRKVSDTKKKKNQERDEKEQRSKLSRQQYETNRSLDREYRYKNRGMNISYRYFTKVYNSMPEYMLNKIANMPNNKGYIWRGVYCYGDLPAEQGQPSVMFEKNKDLLIIHEWTKYEYNIWHKKGKNRRVLHVSKPRSTKVTRK